MLYLVGTPLGNAQDLSPRARKILAEVDFIAAEDTRVTRNLLQYLDIKLIPPMLSYHTHNRRSAGSEILIRLQQGQTGALVTDAGMPAVSDPGEELVDDCLLAGVEVVAVPGPSAVTTAVALSGMDCRRFCFEGFLPLERRPRHARLDALATEERAMVFYEAPHKLLNTLRDLRDALGDRTVSISREMTKLHEETRRGLLSEQLRFFAETPPRGEFVLVVEGAPPPSVTLDEAVRLACVLMEEGEKSSAAAARAARETGLPRRDIYKQLTTNAQESKHPQP